MAKGSEQFSWKLFGTPPEERVCHVCGVQLRVKDVARHHARPPRFEPEFYCREHRGSAL